MRHDERRDDDWRKIRVVKIFFFSCSSVLLGFFNLHGVLLVASAYFEERSVKKKWLLLRFRWFWSFLWHLWSFLPRRH
ncbi:hypothetical protein TNCV_4128821 [Trichonephila clavipes]|nr:hypothetical protein TNCV_4128821 [Trichonephila clavipes]